MSSAAYEIKMIGDKQIRAALARYPQISQDVLKPTTTRAVILVESAIKPHTPVHMGRLISSIHHQVTPIGGGDVQGVVGTNVDYAIPVELGRPPGSFPPMEPIKRWCHLVLGDEGLWFVVARAIATRGTAPRAMFATGWKESIGAVRAMFDQALKEIVRRIARAGGGG